MSTQKSRLTSACTRPPTALFLKGAAPAKALVIEACLAGPVSGDARGWAAEGLVYRFRFIAFYHTVVGVSFIAWLWLRRNPELLTL